MKTRTTAIILAAGSGNRLPGDQPKQLRLLGGKPILYYSLRAFEDSRIDDIIVVTREQDMGAIRQLAAGNTFAKWTKTIAGGAYRHLSVYNGLISCDNTEYVLVHDSARPFVTVSLIDAMIDGVYDCPACVPGVPVTDTIKIADVDGYVTDTPQRQYLRAMQTPQAFSYKLLMQSYTRMPDGFIPTDDAQIIEHYGEHRVRILPGDPANVKITTQRDLDMAEHYIERSDPLPS